MEAESVEVWVEVPMDADSRDSAPRSRLESKLDAAVGQKKKGLEVNNKQRTVFRRGICSKEAYLAADLMKKAAESRAAVESAMSAAKKAKGAAPPSPMSVEDEVLIPVTLFEYLESKDSPFQHQGDDSEVTINVNVKFVFPANSESLVKTCADLTGLNYMEEPNILCSLQDRYQRNQIYTNVASILLAINPYQELAMYDNISMMKYRSTSVTGKTTGNAPHVFAVAEEAFANLTAPLSLKKVTAPKNQSMIVCGESGSGKTESAKYLMRYLTNRTYDLSLTNKYDVTQQSEVERQVLEANVILESFGNANTLLNNNSSRFGKFTKVFIHTRITAGEVKEDVGRVIGAATETYLLEKSRVVRQNPGERTFHVLYQIIAGSTPEQKERFHLTGLSAQDFHFLNQGETYTVPGIDDVDWFKSLQRALDVVKVKGERQCQLLDAVAAVIHLGNVKFISDGTTDDGSEIAEESKQHLESCATLLGVNPAGLEKRLRTANIRVMRDTIAKKLNPRDAVLNRDAIARSLYSDTFNWVVDCINETLVGSGEYSWIGILDVFGFESFENNSFEQFCINFANERLQQHFNFSILLSEQREYALEGIMWEPLDIPDNQDTIDLVQTKTSGLLALLDSTCKLKSATPDAWVKSIFDTHKGHRRVQPLPQAGGPKQIKRGQGFGIDHYAGIVYYNAEEFLLKNTDNTDPDTAALFKSSSKEVMTELVIPREVRKKGKTEEKKGAMTAFSSVSSTFVSQLAQLMEILSSTQSYFIRAIKPNTLKKKAIFDPIYVRPQLKCGGLVEAVKMLKRGYPTRVTFDEIYRQYSPLLNPQPVFELNKRDFSQAVLSLFDLNKNEYQLGLTKVFFKAGRRALLEQVMNRDSKLSPEDMNALMNFLMRKRWQRVLATVRSGTMFGIRLRQYRSIAMWFKCAKIGIVYRKTFYKLMRKVQKRRREGAAFTIQSLCHAVIATKRALKGIEDMREQKRLAELEAKRKEEEARMAEELKAKKKAEREAYIANEAAEKERRRREREEFEERERQEKELRKKREQEMWEQEIEEKRRRRAEEERLWQEEQERRMRMQQEAAASQSAAMPMGMQPEQFLNLLKQLGVKVPDQPPAAGAASAGSVAGEAPAGTTTTASPVPAAKAAPVENAAWIEARDKVVPPDSVANVLNPFEDVPVPDEAEIRFWIEEILEFKFEDEFFNTIADGAILLDIANAVNPQLKLTPHEKKTDFTIKDHYQRFSYSIGTFGVTKHYAIAPSFLDFDEGKQAILRCLGVVRAQCERKGIKPTKQIKVGKGKTVDSKTRIQELEKELQDMQAKLDEVLEENARLQEAVVKLDEINRKMVVDLMKELSARSAQGIQRKASSASVLDEEEEEEASEESADEEKPKFTRGGSSMEPKHASIRTKYSNMVATASTSNLNGGVPASGSGNAAAQAHPAAAAGPARMGSSAAVTSARLGAGGKPEEKDCSVM